MDLALVVVVRYVLCMNLLRSNENILNQLRAFLVLNNLDMPEFSRALHDLDSDIHRLPLSCVVQFTIASAPLESGWSWENRVTEDYSVDQYIAAPAGVTNRRNAIEAAPSGFFPYTPGMAVITMTRAFDADEGILSVDVHAKLAPRL